MTGAVAMHWYLTQAFDDGRMYDKNLLHRSSITLRMAAQSGSPHTFCRSAGVYSNKQPIA